MTASDLLELREWTALESAIHDALRDMAEWRQLAKRQYAEMPHNAPLCPTSAGIESSERRTQVLARGLTALRTKLEEANQPHCTCHERDSSYACDYCKAQGYRGHMERSAE